MGRVRKAAEVFAKIRASDHLWPLSWDDIVALIEYQQLCNQADAQAALRPAYWQTKADLDPRD